MTSLIKLHDFPGGVHPPDRKAQSLQLPLGSLPLPPTLVLPLNQHMGTPAKPIVALGDRVLKGQRLAEAEGVFSAHVHAPSSGRVTAIGPHTFPHPSGMLTECITLETDGQDEWIALEPCEDYQVVDRLDLLARIRAAGVAGLGGAGFPTAVKLAPKSIHVIDTLVINGAECEPYITADDMLMQTRAQELLEGTLLVSHILHHPKHLLIGVEDNKPKAISTLQEALRELRLIREEAANIQIVTLPTKYPSGGAKQLVQILTGREIPSDHHSADIGVICINVGTAVAAWRAVRFGEPLISRITTVVGETLQIQRNIDVLLGTPIDYVLQHHGFDLDKDSPVIMGGPMMGFVLPNLSAPVIKTTNCLLAPSDRELPPPPPAQACIRCGLCAEACPASLMPQQLFWYAQAEDQEKLKAHNLFDCIECGACAYVCPSAIPLVQYYRAAKGSIRQHDIEKEKADRSRRRFEFRKERYAREEAEKEAKRLARKQAAEEAKQKLAEKNTASVLTEAVAKTQANQPAPAEQQARLERLLEAARNSLAHARQPLIPREPDSTITDEQREKQAARIKQAELKLGEAEKKLADFLAIQSDTSTDKLNTPAE